MRKSIILLAIALMVMAGCKKENPPQPSDKWADLVVYGDIYTAEGSNPSAEAFAVKDGKFIYVGTKDSIQEYINDKTTIINHDGQGMVIPGCYEGHAHYMMQNGINLMNGPAIDINTSVAAFMEEVKSTYQRAKAEGKSSIYGFGWMYQVFDHDGMPTRQQLDSICPDIALFVSDSEGHKGLANTLCLQNAGIMDAEGNVLITEIRGGEICMGNDGKPNGLLKEQAGTYVRNRGINFDEIFPTSSAITAVELSQQALLKNGFVSYMDGWANYYGTNAFYEAASTLDNGGNLNILLGLPYEFESSCDDVYAELAKATATKQYTKGHINANYVKIFIDGTVESCTGLTIEPYQSGLTSHGIANWEEHEVEAITEYANAHGMTMHVHTMGDGAVHRAVNAFINGGKPEARNTLVHVRNMVDGDFQRIADNNIVAVSGLLWHAMDDFIASYLDTIIPANLIGKAYPMRSYFEHKAIMSSHSDFPATSGSPNDPFGIMEIAVRGQVPGILATPFWEEELITREQALQALTINGAYQMHVENERGSIKAGKYADFVLADQDVFKCPVTEIHNTKVVSTWFEGEKVYQR